MFAASHFCVLTLHLSLECLRLAYRGGQGSLHAGPQRRSEDELAQSHVNTQQCVPKLETFFLC